MIRTSQYFTSVSHSCSLMVSFPNIDAIIHASFRHTTMQLNLNLGLNRSRTQYTITIHKRLMCSVMCMIATIIIKSTVISTGFSLKSDFCSCATNLPAGPGPGLRQCERPGDWVGPELQLWSSVQHSPGGDSDHHDQQSVQEQQPPTRPDN